MYDNLFLFRACCCAALFFTSQIACADAFHDYLYKSSNITVQQTGKIGNATYYIPNAKDIEKEVKKRHFESFKRAANGTYSGVRNTGFKFLDRVGQSIDGTASTSTVMPAAKVISKGLGGLMIADIATSHYSRLKREHVSDDFSRGIEDGDWGRVAGAVAKVMDWTGIGGKINSFIEPETYNSVSNYLDDEVSGRARALFDNYQLSKGINPYDYQNYRKVKVWHMMPDSEDIIIYYFVKKSDLYEAYDDWGVRLQMYTDELNRLNQIPITISKGLLIYPMGYRIQIFVDDSTQKELEDYKHQNAPSIESILPNKNQIEQAILARLTEGKDYESILNSAWSANVANEQNTNMYVNGSDSQNTYKTDAYTPKGENTAYQSQIKINQDGTINIKDIPRYDLAPGTAQAPIKSSSVAAAENHNQVNNNKQGDHDNKQEPKNEKEKANDKCKDNPKLLECAEIENIPIDDPKIPETTKKIDFEPANTFAVDGVCPEPITFEILNKKQSISYEYICNYAHGIRAMVILCGMVISFLIAINSIKEL